MRTATSGTSVHAGSGGAFGSPSAANSDAVILRSDDSLGMHRVEVAVRELPQPPRPCLRGRGYPTPTDQRYCINSISLRLAPKS